MHLFDYSGLTVLGGLGSTLAMLLDRSRDLTTLLQSLPTEHRPAAARLIVQLAREGLVTVSDDPPYLDGDLAALAYWDAAGLNSTVVARSLSQARVRVLRVGEIGDVPQYAAELADAGIGVTTEGEASDEDMSIVLCDDYLDPALAEIDAQHRARGVPWLIASSRGPTLWVGPIFQPDQPGCWYCLANRLSQHRVAELCAQEELGLLRPVLPPPANLAATRGIGLHLVALEAMKWLAGSPDPLVGNVLTLETFRPQLTRHRFEPRAQCPQCGDEGLVAAMADRPVILDAPPRADDAADGYRSATPAQMMQRYGHLISPVTGIVKEVVRIADTPDFVNSFRSGPNAAVHARDLAAVRASVRIENGGKGRTPEQAIVGALCEAVERFSGIAQGDERRVRGSLRQLGARAIHPNDVQLFADSQFTDRATWNPEHSAFQFVPRRFDEDAETSWTPMWSLTRGEHRLLPTELLYYGAKESPDGPRLLADSNGTAAGSSLSDAVLQGLLELIERDSVALWWYDRCLLAEVDLDAFNDPWVDRARKFYASLGRELWVLDATADLGVPAMVAVSRRIDSDQEAIVFGFGAHVDPGTALVRALTELNQLLPIATGPSIEAAAKTADPDAQAWLQLGTVAEQPHVAPNPALKPRGPSWWPSPPDGIAEATASVIASIEAAGLEVLVLDQTRPDLNLPVAKMVVPGLRHMWARFAPGRLYDVPVSLGRRDTALTIDQLNPIPMFL